MWNWLGLGRHTIPVILCSHWPKATISTTYYGGSTNIRLHLWSHFPRQQYSVQLHHRNFHTIFDAYVRYSSSFCCPEQAAKSSSISTTQPWNPRLFREHILSSCLPDSCRSLLLSATAPSLYSEHELRFCYNSWHLQHLDSLVVCRWKEVICGTEARCWIRGLRVERCGAHQVPSKKVMDWEPSGIPELKSSETDTIAVTNEILIMPRISFNVWFVFMLLDMAKVLSNWVL